MLEGDLVLVDELKHILWLLAHEQINVVAGQEKLLESNLPLGKLWNRLFDQGRFHLFLDEFGYFVGAAERALAVYPTRHLRVICVGHCLV